MIPFSPPRVDQKTIDAVSEVLRSGWITTGPKTKEFERLLQEYVQSRRVFCCNSNTNGMELFARWLGIGPGDEVIVPAYTYCATANVVKHLGAKPVLVDVLEDFTIDPSEVQKALTEHTKAVVPVDLGGLPAKYDELMSIVQSASSGFQANSDAQNQLGRVALMADSAHAIGARYQNELLGSQADAMVFSFHAVKNLTTAEGGAVSINLPSSIDVDEVYNWLNTRSLHGQSKDALAKTNSNAWEYDVLEAGWKCNMTDLQAAIGLVELERYETETLLRRKHIAKQYADAFSVHSWAITPTLQDDKRETSYHLYLLRVNRLDVGSRNKVIERIFDAGVSVNVHYKPLPLLTAYKEFNMDDYPISKALWENEISLPIYYHLTDEQVEQVIDSVVKAVKSVLG